MAKPKIGSIRTAQPSALSAYMPKAEERAAEHATNSAPVGRPKTLPSEVRSVTFKMPVIAHSELKALAARNRTTVKEIILQGIADQFARNGLSVDMDK